MCAMCMSLCTVVILESRSLGLQRKGGGIFHLQVDMCARPIANKYHEATMKKYLLKRGFKVVK